MSTDFNYLNHYFILFFAEIVVIMANKLFCFFFFFKEFKFGELKEPWIYKVPQIKNILMEIVFRGWYLNNTDFCEAKSNLLMKNIIFRKPSPHKTTYKKQECSLRR